MNTSGENKNANDLFLDVTETFETAKDFLQELDLCNERWHGAGPWIFRGQNDALWRLTPSLFRKPYGDIEADYEYDLVNSFVRHVNLVGLTIPANTMGYVDFQVDKIQTTRRTLTYPSGNGHIYDYTHVAFALAQHSGVPTRLLDFTYDPSVAAWFAADHRNHFHNIGLSDEKVAASFKEILNLFLDSPDNAYSAIKDYIHRQSERIRNLPSDLAVWAIQSNDLLEATSLRMLDHPHSEILNMRAQKGVFLVNTKYGEHESGEWPPFDTDLLRLIDTKGISRLTLPASEISSLRHLLFRKRVASIFMEPTYGAVAKYVVKESEGWTKGTKKRQK